MKIFEATANSPTHTASASKWDKLAHLGPHSSFRAIAQRFCLGREAYYKTEPQNPLAFSTHLSIVSGAQAELAMREPEVAETCQDLVERDSQIPYSDYPLVLLRASENLPAWVLLTRVYHPTTAMS